MTAPTKTTTPTRRMNVFTGERGIQGTGVEALRVQQSKRETKKKEKALRGVTGGKKGVTGEKFSFSKVCAEQHADKKRTF